MGIISLFRAVTSPPKSEMILPLCLVSRRRTKRVGAGDIPPSGIRVNINVIHCNIDDHTKEKCWNLHPELNPKNKKKDNKKKNLMDTDSRNQVERSSDMDEKIICTSM